MSSKNSGQFHIFLIYNFNHFARVYWVYNCSFIWALIHQLEFKYEMYLTCDKNDNR